MRVVHVITCLEMGGAETMLLRLLSRMDRARFEPLVVTLTPPGPVTEPIEALGIPVQSLGVRHGAAVPGALARLTQTLRRERPGIVQTWMYHADLFGGIAAQFAGQIPTIWNIRHGAAEPGSHKRTTLWTVEACARLSHRVPARIVCCSRAARTVHETRGYDPGRMVLIPNGFDVDAFRPDAAARRAVRQELGLPDQARLVGLVARFDPLKDHLTFLRAAALLHRDASDVHFVLCGDGIDWANPALAGPIDRAGIRDRCHLLGRRHDITRMQASFDIATLSSLGEAFPNAVGEAMACGVPCVVTDVGDAAWIVGATGRVVPPGDPAALAAGVDDLLDDVARGAVDAGSVRERIVANFSIPTLVDTSEWVFRQLLHDRDAA